MTNTAALLPSAKSPLQVESRPIPSPSSSQLLIKNHALATNPVDWKIQDYGIILTTYPTILGSDISGTVEAVGPSVSRFKKGDRVTGFAAVIANNDPNQGAFQEYTILNENCTAKIPDFVSFEEGAILPMSVATSGVAIFLDLGVPRPTTGSQNQAEGFVVWGASSSVGSAAVQIAHSLGYTVYAVCSPRHHDNVREYGASHVFDYNDANVITNIVNAAKKSNTPIHLAFDVASANGSSEKVASVLEQQGGGKLVSTALFPEGAKKPKNVETKMTFAGRVDQDAKEFAGWLFNEYLEKSLADKTFVPAPGIEKVDGGIAGVQKALDLHRKGLSGKKIVIPLL
ncbi:MAG: hypothetical protein Q9181_001501 [Wetmoreana brouardii]